LYGSPHPIARRVDGPPRPRVRVAGECCDAQPPTGRGNHAALASLKPRWSLLASSRSREQGRHVPAACAPLGLRPGLQFRPFSRTRAVAIQFWRVRRSGRNGRGASGRLLPGRDCLPRR